MIMDEEFKNILELKGKVSDKVYVGYLENVIKLLLKAINKFIVNKSERRES